VVDALSKRAHEVHVEAINMYMTDLKDQIIVATNSDKKICENKRNITTR
jgi:hypothetical protein